MFAQAMREIAYCDYRVRLEALLHIPTGASDQDIHRMIEAGFSANSVKALCDRGTLSALERDQIIPPKTLQTRLARGQLLTADESDRLYRVVHITAMAEALIADHEKAKRWLSESKDRFSGKSPREMLSTVEGARRVEEMLIQIAEGFAF
ncbi:antitoxin Xre/MbcA/ParS toxin-binding domain-containing protein [Pseudomonas sp. MDT1-16]